MAQRKKRTIVKHITTRKQFPLEKPQDKPVKTQVTLSNYFQVELDILTKNNVRICRCEAKLDRIMEHLQISLGTPGIPNVR